MVLRPESAQPYSSTRYICPVDNKRNVVPIGQRDQSAAALPMRGGLLLTATARFAPRTDVADFVTRVIVTFVVTRVAFLDPSIENGCNFASLLEMLITSVSSLSEIAPARLTFSAR